MIDMKDARCRDAEPETFFVGDPERVAEAKAYCADCPIRVECLTMALKEKLDGVWGGTTQYEREHTNMRRLVHQARIPTRSRRTRNVPLTARQVEAFNETNKIRQQEAGIAGAARALTVLLKVGDQLAPHIRETVELRANRPDLALEELGQALSTPVGRDVVAGRLRRAEALLRPKKKRVKNG